MSDAPAKKRGRKPKLPPTPEEIKQIVADLEVREQEIHHELMSLENDRQTLVDTKMMERLREIPALIETSLEDIQEELQEIMDQKEELKNDNL